MTSGKVATTLGYERRNNPALRIADRDAFVAFMTADQPARPANIANIVAINQGRRALTLDTPTSRPLSVDDVARLRADGHLVIDTRRTAQFGAGHVPGAVNVHLSSPEFEQRVGWVAPPDRPFVLVLDHDEEAAAAVKALAFVGLDARAAGHLAGGVGAWAAEGHELAAIGQVDVLSLAARQRVEAGLTIVDVREPSEWTTGHVPGARNVSYRQLAGSTDALAGAGALAIVCQGGSRSSTATSLLARAGFRDVVNVVGGMTAWVAAGLPVERGAACAR